MGYRRSSLSNLYVDTRTGVYYARAKIHGRTVWKSLRTDSFQVAGLRVRKELADLKKASSATQAIDRGAGTFGHLAELYRKRVGQDARLKPSSKHYRGQTIDAILRARPKWRTRLVRDVRDSDVREWAIEYVNAVHPTRYNNTLGTLRAIFALGIEHGLIASNPARGVSKAHVAPKRLTLPTSEQFAQILDHIESSGSWCGSEAADLVRFLAFSGCRVTEAINVGKEHVDLAGGTIRILGDPVHGTKNREPRTIPLNPSLRELVSRLLEDDGEPRDPKRQGKGFLLKVTSCREALANACRKAGVAKIGHHDLRHLFITRAIEAEVPVPTIARWAGHKDGGSLLMRTYAHLLDAHSRRMADRLTF